MKKRTSRRGNMTAESPGCLARLFGIKPKSSQQNAATLPYRLSSEFFSPAEANFYQVLKQVVGNNLLIFPKVGLGEFIFVTDQNNFQSYRNKIDRKHVDFLLCKPDTLQPVFAIELDDSSHRRATRSERDAFIDSVFAVANIPLVRVPVRASYNSQELNILFSNALQRKEIRTAAQEDAKRVEAVIDNPPTCPNCDVQMVLRIAKKGKNVGDKFWGCPNYPKCKTIIQLA